MRKTESLGSSERFLAQEIWLPFLATPIFARAMSVAGNHTAETGLETGFDLLLNEKRKGPVISHVTVGGTDNVTFLSERRTIKIFANLDPFSLYARVFPIHFHPDEEVIDDLEDDLTNLSAKMPAMGVAISDENRLPQLMLIGENRTGSPILPFNLTAYSGYQQRVVKNLVQDGYQVALFQWVKQGRKLFLPLEQLTDVNRFPRIPLDFFEASIWKPTPSSFK
jgi:hypothetical protein